MRVDDHHADRETIGELAGRAIADAKTYATAQVEVVKQTALTGVDKAKVGVGLIVGGGLIAYAAIIILLVAIFTWLEGEIGPIGAGLIVTGATVAAALLMIKIGIGKLTGAASAMKGNIK